MKVHRSKLSILPVIGLLSTCFTSLTGHAAGTLTPKGSPDLPIQILDHHVTVTINNGFAQTEVVQTFFNPHDRDLEAIYRFPLPVSASLSEVTLTIGEREIAGEVVEREKAESMYESEKQNGNDAGLASKEGFQAFEFRVHPVKAQGETRIRLIYYQPIEIEAGIGRYLYPLEEGGTDDAAASFWNPVHDAVEGTFSAEVELKSAWPLEEVRLPGFENETLVETLGEGHQRLRLDRKAQALNRDLVVYYRLAQDLPGRVELIPFRDDKAAPGTFQLVVTPGIDLQPLQNGADYVYVLDVSGSMDSKLHTLVDGISRTLAGMAPEDRFRIVTFSDSATDLLGGWQQGSQENISAATQTLGSLRTRGSTNLCDGLALAMDSLDDDRATSIVLLTDGVANAGIVDPVEFHKLSKSHDLRVFGFLLGNSGNWPLMRTICEGSGGFFATVSNSDDILGQILQAKGKILHESLHDAELSIRGVKTFETSGDLPRKIYRGEQLILFGRYEKGGEAELVLKARLTGEDKTYRTTVSFPEIDTENPEIERLWALDRIENINSRVDRGEMPETEASEAIRDLGLQYQIVTDETSMLVLSDEAFERHGVARENQKRVQRESAARSVRASTPATNRRVDEAAPLTSGKASGLYRPRSSGGGGALPPLVVVLMAAFSGWAVRLGIRRSA